MQNRFSFKEIWLICVKWKNLKHTLYSLKLYRFYFLNVNRVADKYYLFKLLWGEKKQKCYVFLSTWRPRFTLSIVWADPGGRLFVWTVNHHWAGNGHSVVRGISESNLAMQDIIRHKVNESLMEAYASHMAEVLHIILATIS